MISIDELKKYFTNDKKKLYLIVIGILGIFLLTFSNGTKTINPKNAGKGEASKDKYQSMEYVKNLESNLEKILNEAEGVGRCKVFLTLESSDEKIYAKDQKSNSKQKENNYEQIIDSKYVRPDRQSGKEGVVVKVNAPKIKGILIVCDGGNNNEIINKLTMAISGALGISPNAIHIMKMKS